MPIDCKSMSGLQVIALKLSGENFASGCMNVEHGASIYLRQGSIVLHCGYFLIQMGLLYPKNKLFRGVYQPKCTLFL